MYVWLSNSMMKIRSSAMRSSRAASIPSIFSASAVTLLNSIKNPPNTNPSRLFFHDDNNNNAIHTGKCTRFLMGPSTYTVKKEKKNKWGKMAVREKRGWAVKDGEYGRQWAIKFLGTRTGRMIFPANSANTLLISFFFFSFLVVTRLFFFVNDAEGKNKRFLGPTWMMAWARGFITMELSSSAFLHVIILIHHL